MTAIAPSTTSGWRLVIAFGVGGLASPVLFFLLGGVIAFTAPYPAGLRVMVVGFWVGVASMFVGCLLAVRQTSPKGAGGLTAVGRALIVLVSFVAPFAVVVGSRLAEKSCTGLNLLGLPWPTELRDAVGWGSLAVILVAIASIVVGLTRPGSRSAAVVMLLYGAVTVVPVLIAVFLSVYGDPGPDCVPI